MSLEAGGPVSIPVIAGPRALQAVHALLVARFNHYAFSCFGGPERRPGDEELSRCCILYLPRWRYLTLVVQAGYYLWSCPRCSCSYHVTNAEIDAWERVEDARLVSALRAKLERAGGVSVPLELELDTGERVIVSPVPEIEREGGDE